MRINRDVVPQSTLQEFAEKHDLVMRVIERGASRPSHAERYCAYFEHCEIKGAGVLIGVHGNGDTEDAAIEDYMRQISEKRLVVDAYQNSRTEITAPRFTAVWRATG
jgi:hypothetical protein